MIHAAYPQPLLPPGTPLPRSRPVNTSSATSRESNALRASILDTALELGIGNNSLVTAWMFDNSLQEEEEDEARRSPVTNTAAGKGSSSDHWAYNSTNATSPRGIPSPSLAKPPHFPQQGPRSPPVRPSNGMAAPPKPSTDTESPYLASPASARSPALPSFPSQCETPIPPHPETPKKLRKKNRGDGYESDGGYMSEVSRKSAKKQSKAKLKEQKDEERARKKSFGIASTKAAAEDALEAARSKSPFKSKSKKKRGSTDGWAGYDTDAGYISAGSNLKKPKRSFFNLSLKSSRGNLKETPVPSVPPVPTHKDSLTSPAPGRFTGSLADTLSLTGRSPDSPVPVTPSASHSPSIAAQPSRQPHEQSAGPLPSIAPIQPMSFENFTASPNLPSSFDQPIRQPTKERSSLSSESSTSQGSRRLVHFRSREHNRQPTESFTPNGKDSARNSNFSSSNGHGGTWSVSGPGLSGLQSAKSSPPWQTPVGSPAQSPKLSRRFSISSNATGTSALKAPPVSISYPLTRAGSPVPPLTPISPLNIIKRDAPALAPLDVEAARARPPSPNPLTPDSPYVVLFQTGGILPSGDQHSGEDMPVPPSATISEAPSPPPEPAPVDPAGPRSLASPPPTHGRRSPSPMLGRRLASGPVVDELEAPLPSPNVLAYYDIPPPTPPPSGPLPNVPRPSSPPPPPSHLRAKVLERQRTGADIAVSGAVSRSPTLQRGREPPFPSRPLTSPMSPPAGIPGAGVGLEARARSIPARYTVFPMDEQFMRPMEVAKVPGEQWDHSKVTIIPPRSAVPPPAAPPPVAPPPPPPIEEEEEEVRLAYHDDERDSWASRHSSPDHDSGDEALRDVLDRLMDPGAEDADAEPAHALPTRRSFGELRDKHESFSIDDYYSARDTTYTWDDGATGRGARESRWSGSIYSRMSILDADESEATRDRFVKRVEAMMARKEKEVVPPVPKIPEGLVGATSRWGKF